TKYSPRFSKVGEEGQGVTFRESFKRPMSQLQKKMEKMESVSSVKQQSEITRRIEQLLIKKGMFDEAIVKALVKAWKQQQLKRKALVIGLLRKDKFFEFPFLELIMHHPAISEKRVRQGADRLAAAWSRTAKVLARKFRVLTSDEKIQFHTLMNYGVISPRIKKVVKDMLEALPVESLRLIAALADLNEEILQQVMDKNENTQPSSASEKEIIVENGGICLIAAYLPAFFKALGYVDSNRFKTKAHVIRAIYLLHYIVHGKTAAPEYLLQLNKLLCGWRLASPLPHRKRWRKSELLEADELIQSIISNWSALKNTSIEGLRSNFLQRKAILTENEHYWTLKVEKKGVDILLGTINWSYSLVKLPWIKKPLQVEW
ncbi:MAG TPA: contractile injection system tape measure protein, partial [Chitinophagaceae bacterium]